MIPILFDTTETAFATNGIGRLSDAISCIVTEERNGAYELAMEYFEGGKHAEDIAIDRIIFAKPSALHDPQPFRIYKVTKPLNQRFKVLARHISYDLNYISVNPCGPYNSAYTAMNGLKDNANSISPFTVGTVTATGTASFQVTEPASFRNWIGGREGSVIDTYGGELEWDRFTVKLHSARGINRGLTLRYGKNISDISQEQGIDHTISGVTPFMKAGDGSMLTLPEHTVFRPSVYSTPQRVVTMDCSQYVDEQAIREANPTETDQQIDARLISAMRTVAQDYVNGLSPTPVSSIEVAFVNLGDTEEYKDIKTLFIQADLCDTVSVEYPRLGISTTAKIIKTEYNVLLERFEKLTIGKIKASLGDKLQDMSNQSVSYSNSSAAAVSAQALVDAIKKALAALLESKGYTNDRETAIRADEALAIAVSLAEAKTYADAREQDAINAAATNTASAIAANTALITGANGGYIKFKYNANNKPIEILIMDAENENDAVKIWRWNINGLGYSKTGKDGPFLTALSSAGIFNTDFIAANTLSGASLIAGTINAGKITTGYLDASIIKVGSITDQAGKNVINMSNGSFSLADGRMLYAQGSDYISLYDNLSLRLNGIPLAGILYKNIGRAYDSSKAVSSYNTVILRPYDCTFNGVIENITSYTYDEDGKKLIKDVPVPDGEIGRTYGQVSMCVPGYTISSGGGFAYKADPEIIWIWRSFERFTTQEQYEAWAQDYQFCKRVTKDGYIYGVYAYIELRSSAAAEEYLEINVTYPTWQHTEE